MPQPTAVPTVTPIPNPALISQGQLNLAIFTAAGLTVLFFFFIKILIDLRGYRYK